MRDAARRAARAALVLVLGAAGAGDGARACDTWVALGDQTTCGQAMLGKNSDRPVFGCQPLVLHARGTWPDGAEIDLQRVKIAQARETLATLGSSPYWSWGYEEGINEHGVAIGNEAIWTKELVEELADHKAGKGPPPGPTGMDLVRLGLERGKTAREAMQAVAHVVETYGQFGSATPTRGVAGAYHNSFLIADAKEAWILETTGRHWVAKRLTKGATSISNAPSLGADFDLASARVVPHALAKGWWPEDKAATFHFQHAYSRDTRKDQPPVTRVHPRAAISRRLLEGKAGQIDTRWMMHVARAGGIDLNITASSCVAVLPADAGKLPVFWWCPAVPSSSCYVPFFIHGRELPKIVTSAGVLGNRDVAPSKVGRDTFSPQSYWWLFRDLSDKVSADRKARGPAVRAAFDALEKEFASGLAPVVQKAVRLRQAAQHAQAARALDAYSDQCLQKVLAQLHALRAQFAAKP